MSSANFLSLQNKLFASKNYRSVRFDEKLQFSTGRGDIIYIVKKRTKEAERCKKKKIEKNSERMERRHSHVDQPRIVQYTFGSRQSNSSKMIYGPCVYVLLSRRSDEAGCRVSSPRTG